MAVVLEIHRSTDWMRLSSGRTDERGRLVAMPENADAGPGVYRFTFDTGDYHRSMNITPFFPEVQVVFTVVARRQHKEVLSLVETTQPGAFYAVDEVTAVSEGIFPMAGRGPKIVPAALRTILRKSEAMIGEPGA